VEVIWEVRLVDSSQSIEAAMWVMVVLQTLGAVDMPGRGKRKLPSPRVYVSVIISFGVLELLADMGLEKAAKYMAWVIVVATLVLGPFGTKLSGFLNVVAADTTTVKVP
jgi:uncharacterized protein YhhL (DUF1145 family)